MNLRKSLVAGACAAALLGTATVAVAGKDSYQEKNAQKLAKALEGRTPGQPVNCISNRSGSDMQVIDDHTILFRDGRTVYVQKPHGGCQGLGNGNYALVSRISGVDRLCSGQISQMMDRSSGITAGSCVFDSFVPYRKAN